MIFYNTAGLIIRSMAKEDAEVFYKTFLSYGWHPNIDTYLGYYKEQEEKSRLVFIAEYEDVVAGICTLILNPDEGPFGKQGIPEIADLCVFFDKHKKGIGGKILDVVEAEAAKISKKVYLAVGVHSGYGAAQRIYVKRGYIPDGSGVWYKGKQLEQYANCCNDDDLLLFLCKELDHV
jgi:GNAT superfamily N-acetyltransferase